MYSDFRSWLDDVAKKGEVKNINGASCELEMSAIQEIVAGNKVEPKPVLLFDDIPGYPKGFRTAFGVMGSPWRLAKTLGLPETELNRINLLMNWRKKVKQLKLVPPRFVEEAPILENVDTGKQINLLKFPSPRFHELDGGRYFGTCHGVIQQDPDSGYINIGTYRVMLVDDRRLALHILEGQHGGVIMNSKYFARGKTMPVVIGIGMDPALWFCACHRSVPWGVSEFDFAGGIKGQPIQVIKGKYTGLPLPAQAEIVIEGECRPEERVNEGPFGEWQGYYGNLGLSPVPEPVIEVKAVYYRNNPIMTCAQPTSPVRDLTGLMAALGESTSIWNRLETCGVQGVKGVWTHSESAGGSLLVVVSIEQLYAGHSREAGMVAGSYPSLVRYVVVVEDDIDPSNLEDVIWAIVTRGKPEQAISIISRFRSNSADPTITIAEKAQFKNPPKPLLNSRVFIDACRPFEQKDQWYPVARMSPELMTKTLAKWQSLFDEISEGR